MLVAVKIDLPFISFTIVTDSFGLKIARYYHGLSLRTVFCLMMHIFYILDQDIGHTFIDLPTPS